MLTVMIKAILKLFKPKKVNLELADWYEVTWDDEYIYRNVIPPNKEAWNDKFRWKDIIRICFEATDYLYPDDIYFFTSERPESYLIPAEAKGASELWEKVIEKGLFDPELAVKAATAVSGMFCWPKETS
jgi:hypothetical protein